MHGLRFVPSRGAVSADLLRRYSDGHPAQSPTPSETVPSMDPCTQKPPTFTPEQLDRELAIVGEMERRNAEHHARRTTQRDASEASRVRRCESCAVFPG